MDKSNLDPDITDPRYLHSIPVFKEEPRSRRKPCRTTWEPMPPKTVTEAVPIELRWIITGEQFALSLRHLA